MSNSRHTEALMIGALQQMGAGRKAEDVAREAGVSIPALHSWKRSLRWSIRRMPLPPNRGPQDQKEPRAV